MKDTIEVEIIDWEKYNPRKDIKNPVWFALSNRFIEDPEFYDFSSEEKLTWIYILSIASQKNTKNVLIFTKHYLRIFNFKLDVLKETIRKLSNLKITRTCKSIRTRHVRDTYGIRTLQDRTGQDITRQDTTGQDRTVERVRAAADHELVKIWNENCGKLSKVVTINAKRRKSIESRWKELDELQWVEVVKKISSSDFCNGKNDRGWKADFDFLLKPDTATRTLEGRYDNREGIKNGMTEDGRYLTNAMKRSHNNLAMFKKLNGDESEERDVEASVSDG